MKKRIVKKYHLKKEVKEALVDAGIDVLGLIALAIIWNIILYMM